MPTGEAQETQADDEDEWAAALDEALGEVEVPDDKAQGAATAATVLEEPTPSAPSRPATILEGQDEDDGDIDCEGLFEPLDGGRGATKDTAVKDAPKLKGGPQVDMESALDEAFAQDEDEENEAAMEEALEEIFNCKDDAPAPGLAEAPEPTPAQPSHGGEHEQDPPQAAEAPAAPPTPQGGDGVPEEEGGKPKRKAGFEDEGRYMQDQNGQRLYKWVINYATRGGGGVAQCRDKNCLERQEQAGMRRIEKGCLRIGRRVLMPDDKHGEDGEGGKVMILWHHARCMFNTFLRARKSTRTIESPDDLEGFDKIDLEDQAQIRRFILGSEDVRGARTRTSEARKRAPGGGAGADEEKTPKNAKRGAAFDPDKTPANKKNRPAYRQVKAEKGERVWTYCRVRPPAPERPGADGGQTFAVKSAKPELGMIVESEKEGTVIIQFESKEHEEQRVELWGRRRAVKAFLRYPRTFEGKKQRIPMNWIQWDRPPPLLCSCKVQSWAHQCDCSGIACGRGTQTKIWGCDQ